MAIKRSLLVCQLKISPPLFLAPMVGVSHSALRSILHGYGGVGLFSTEMLSARRLPSENKAISPYLLATERERPLSYQLFVTAKEEVGKAIIKLHEFGADAVDLNLGCPAPAIRQAGGGGVLMKDSRKVRDIVRTARKLTPLPLTAKIRLGHQLDAPALKSFSRMLEDEGIDLLTVHARLQHEKFCRPPRWEWIALVKDWLSIPVVANGSIFSVDDARTCLRTTGADGLMIGRAAPQRPWIFADIAREVFGCDIPRLELTMPEIFFRMVSELADRFRPERRLGRLKEFTHYFARNYPYGHHLASAVQSSSSMHEAALNALAFFEKNDQVGLQTLFKHPGAEVLLSGPED